MNTNDVNMQKVCAQLENVRLPRWRELPDLELYMDQLISLMGRYLKDYPGSGDKGLTAAMVNNYVKQKVIPAPDKKKYDREHLAYLIMICVLKPVVPIPQVAAMIEGEIGELSFGSDLYRMEDGTPVEIEPLEYVYDRFCDRFEETCREIAAREAELPEDSDSKYTRIMMTALKAQAELALALSPMGGDR
jgi:hypothetical protein